MTFQTTDHQEYADDTILQLKTLNKEEIHLQLKHYQLTTKSRKLKINRDKVEMLTKHKPFLKQNPLPEPFNKIKIKKEGKILGKMIHIDPLKNNACAHRIQLAKNVWRLTRKNSFKTLLSISKSVSYYGMH